MASTTTSPPNSTPPTSLPPTTPSPPPLPQPPRPPLHNLRRPPPPVQHRRLQHRPGPRRVPRQPRGLTALPRRERAPPAGQRARLVLLPQVEKLLHRAGRRAAGRAHGREGGRVGESVCGHGGGGGPCDGRKDVVGTVVAGLSVAGFFSVWNRLSYSMAITSAKRGLAFGVVFGLAQDLLRLRRRWEWSALETTTTEKQQASG
ncbi:uncharacterized protein LAJ45_03855 [Morchella importuna]|uniref:uncharacterized protein n=1 Tax=Morchella importuna TaxID=1174673 RepID=UPI001E8E3503|nr:uncharacterized protein LAJ45_03855 [Morchella importuna]KAH8151862.1 hypothetical protein LAJ45_03855 [Morchella importuna]